ncbi:MAG: GNAT family N-acetyltransferase [Minisyncoccia bacterium]
MKNKLKLILPNRKYAASYIKMEREFEVEGIRGAAGSLDALYSLKDFSSYNKKAVEKRKGINIPKGKVPSTLYWAVVGNKVVGRLSLRHRLWKEASASHIGYAVKTSERRKGYGTEMLRLGLLQAKKLGIKKVVMGCREDNVGSKKIIEANGGIFMKKYLKEKVSKLRFYIKN